ncbi:MAG: hypothetical protein WDM85_13115 [Caulobacteraceae bacterium]
MSRMPFLYAQERQRKPKWLKLALQLLLAGEVLTFCAFMLLHTP